MNLKYAKLLLGIAFAIAMNNIHEKDIFHGFLCPDFILLDDDFYPKIKLPFSFSINNQKDWIIQHCNF